MATNEVCKCGAESQTTGSFLYSQPHGIDGLFRLDEDITSGCKKPAWTFDEKLKRQNERVHMFYIHIF